MGLLLYLDDGRIEIDSNTVERSIRPLALSRKNALFGYRDAGGERWAILASLIETAKLSGINPEAWLADVLARLASGHSHARYRRSAALALAIHRKPGKSRLIS